MKAQITALFASDDRKLGKTFSKRDGELEVSSYPHVRNFRTEHRAIRSLDEMLEFINDVAERGGCLLKGLCHRDLDNESRAGSTESQDATDWICLDLDRVESVDTVEAFLDLLPPPFQQTSYIVQYSSSMGIVDGALSAHIFMLIKPTLAPVLKTWLMRMNFELPTLRSELSLARSGVALKYKLDISTCQNDKLLYITPATLKRGVKDKFKGKRVQLVKRRLMKLSYDFATEIDTREVQRAYLKALNVLRKADGLSPRRTDSYMMHGSTEVLKNVKADAQVTGFKRERGFSYLNLNGGDSWGYFHPDTDPEILFNFKGEPNYLIREFLPEYYKQASSLAEEARRLRDSASDSDAHDGDRDRRTGEEATPASETTDEEGEGWYTLVGINAQSGAYFGLRYSPSEESFRFADIGSRIQIKDYCKEYKVPVPEFLERYDVIYDFSHSDYKIDWDAKRINLYNPPPFLNVRKYPNPPKTIARIMRHVTGDDDEAYERFLNWNACVVQHRRLIGTAWLLSGTQGTGKGVYFNEIMSKILGLDYVTRTTLPVFEKEFNAFMERALLVFVDEIRITELSKASTALSNLKQLITDSNIAIRKMRTDQYLIQNHANFVFASNHHDSMEVDPSDRRFLIAPRQEAPLSDVLDISKLEGNVERELDKFAGYLLGRKADIQFAREMYHSAERERLQHLTRDSSDEVIDALRRGNARFFVDNAPDKELTGKLALDTGLNNPPSYEMFLNLILGNLGHNTSIPRDMLEVLFYYICGITFKTPHKFTKFLGKRGLETRTVRVGDDVVRGVGDLIFTADDRTIREWKLWLRKRNAHIKPAPASSSSKISKKAKS